MTTLFLIQFVVSFPLQFSTSIPIHQISFTYFHILLLEINARDNRKDNQRWTFLKSLSCSTRKGKNGQSFRLKCEL